MFWNGKAFETFETFESKFWKGQSAGTLLLSYGGGHSQNSVQTDEDKIDGNVHRVIRKCCFMVPLGDVTEEVNTVQIKTCHVPIISRQILGSLWILLPVKEVRNIDVILRKQQYVSVLSFFLYFPASLCAMVLLILQKASHYALGRKALNAESSFSAVCAVSHLLRKCQTRHISSCLGANLSDQAFVHIQADLKEIIFYPSDLCSLMRKLIFFIYLSVQNLRKLCVLGFSCH